MSEGDYKKNDIKTSYLESFVLVCIILNVVTMAMTYEGSSDKYDEILLNINTAFTAVFIMEAIIKITAYGFLTYIKSGWN